MPPAGGSLRKKLLATTLASGVAFLVGELFVRGMIGAPLPEREPTLVMQASPTRGWMMVPGKDHYTYDNLVRVNSLGLRGPEPGEKGDRRRVLALGDSLTYGQGVGEDETVPFLLERFLGDLDPEGRRWQVVNGGHRAYDTAQELALLAELGPTLRPDHVVLFWYWNDIYAVDIQSTYERLRRRGIVAFDTGYPMQGWPLFRWRARQILRRSALLMFVYDGLRGERHEPIDDALRAESLATLEQRLVRLKSLCAELEARPWFALIPDPARLVGPHDSEELASGAAELAGRLGLPVIDLFPMLEDCTRSLESLPIIQFDGHYLPVGNRTMGEACARALLGLPVD